MKKKLLIAIIFIMCGCAKIEDIPKYVVEDVQNYMSKYYDVKNEEYIRIEDSKQAENYGLDMNEERYQNDDVHVYKFKTNEFDFYAFNYTSDGAITSKNQSIFTNLTSVLYKKNINSIITIANKYNVKVVDNLSPTIFSREKVLELNLSGLSENTTKYFIEELLTITDIKTLIKLKYDKYIKEDGTISFNSSGYDENMIWDYSSIEGYYDTTCTSCRNLLTICAREYYK